MRRVFKKVIAGTMTMAMAVVLLVGVSIAPTTVKAEGTDVSSAITPWVVYSAGQITRSKDPDGWPIRYYKSFTTTAGESKSDWDANFPNQQYVDGGEETWNTTKAANGFTADIANTGWDAQYEGEGTSAVRVGDNPYMLKATMPAIKLEEGHFYSISMDLAWTDGPTADGNYLAPEKNVQILVNDGNTNNLDSQKVTIKSGTSIHFETQRYEDGLSKVATYGTNNLEVVIAMGAFLDSFLNELTTEAQGAAGVLKVTNLTIVDEGKDSNYVPTPGDKPTPPAVTDSTTKAPENPTTKASEKPSSKVKLDQVKNVKAKNNGKGKVKITWAKVKNAKKYQIKVGSKKYTATKKKLTVKKLKKGKNYTIKVRAMKNVKNGTTYTAGKWSKKVKVKIKK